MRPPSAHSPRRSVAEFPSLNVLINNAGIMRAEKLLAQQADLADAEAIVATNLLGPIRLTAALLPHLQKQPRAAIMNVSSGLAFLPLALTPTYCATKAAIHSYTLSLRYQLRATAIEVLELIPPYVQTDLMNGADDPRAMPLDQFIAEVMEILKQQPTPPEICVENVKAPALCRRIRQVRRRSSTASTAESTFTSGPCTWIPASSPWRCPDIRCILELRRARGRLVCTRSRRVKAAVSYSRIWS